MINLDKTQIILASQSPRRKELLSLAGYNYEIVISELEEFVTSTVPKKVVSELSLQKAQAVYHSLMTARQSISGNTPTDASLLVIGADTVVAKDNIIMGKPKTPAEAYNMIHSLQDNTHQVYTGVTLILHDFSNASTKVHTFFEATDVTLYPMSSGEINDYISTGDCYDKAGGYGIQGPFGIFVKKIDGDYNNVVGLPIARLYHEIRFL